MDLSTFPAALAFTDYREGDFYNPYPVGSADHLAYQNQMDSLLAREMLDIAGEPSCL